MLVDRDRQVKAGVRLRSFIIITVVPLFRYRQHLRIDPNDLCQLCFTVGKKRWNSESVGEVKGLIGKKVKAPLIGNEKGFRKAVPSTHSPTHVEGNNIKQIIA